MRLIDIRDSLKAFSQLDTLTEPDLDRFISEAHSRVASYADWPWMIVEIADADVAWLAATKGLRRVVSVSDTLADLIRTSAVSELAQGRWRPLPSGGAAVEPRPSAGALAVTAIVEPDRWPTVNTPGASRLAFASADSVLAPLAVEPPPAAADLIVTQATARLALSQGWASTADRLAADGNAAAASLLASLSDVGGQLAWGAGIGTSAPAGTGAGILAPEGPFV